MTTKKAGKKTKKVIPVKPVQLDYTKEACISYTISRLPVRLHKAIRLKAAMDDVTNIDVIINALEQYLTIK